MTRPILVGYDPAADDRAPVEFGTEAHCPVIVLARGAETGLEALVDEQMGATA